MQSSNNYEINRLKIQKHLKKKKTPNQKLPIKKHKQEKVIKESRYDFLFLFLNICLSWDINSKIWR